MSKMYSFPLLSFAFPEMDVFNNFARLRDVQKKYLFKTKMKLWLFIEFHHGYSSIALFYTMLYCILYGFNNTYIFI